MSFSSPILLPGGRALIVDGKFQKHAVDCCCDFSCVSFAFSGGATDDSDDVKIRLGSIGYASVTEPGIQNFTLEYDPILHGWFLYYNQLYDGNQWKFFMLGDPLAVPIGVYNFGGGLSDWTLILHTGGGSSAWDSIRTELGVAPCPDWS